MKRILSGIFAALLILCALPVAAFAEQQPSDIDPITVQPISASGGEIVRPTWLAYGPITQYPAEGGTWEYGFWDAKVRSYYTVDRCHGSTVVLNGNTVRSVVFHSPPKTILVEMSKISVRSQMHAKYSALVLQDSCFTHLCYP